MNAITLVCGLPNSGKTTYSTRYDTALHYDDISRLSIKERDDVYRASNAECFEGIFNTARSRRNILAQTKRERKVCIWINTPLEVCLARENRGRPPEVVLHHWQTFEPPTMDEGWDEVIVIE